MKKIILFRELLITLGIVFCFTTGILILAGAPPLASYFHILKGSLGSWIKFSHVIKNWIPLSLCACGLLYTFRINLWNIGVEGQMIMGAVFSTLMLRTGIGGAIPFWTLLSAFAAGVCGGALWAILAGLLKTRGGINEIFAGLGLNFVAQGIVLWLIFGPWKRPGIASMSGTELLSYDLWLPSILSIRLSPVGLLCIVAAILVTALMLQYSRIGLRLRAIGNNPVASQLYGLKPDRYMLIAIFFGGGFAGLAGTLQVTDVYHRLIPSISSNYGYLALLVVMLANFNVWLTPVIAFFFACLNTGSIQLPIVLQLDSSISGVIQGAFVLATLAVHSWRWRDRLPL